MVGHILQHLAECNAHAVIIVHGTNAYWFPMAKQATAQSRVMAQRNKGGIFEWPSQGGTFRRWRYPRWPMMAYEVDFRRC